MKHALRSLALGLVAATLAACGTSGSSAVGATRAASAPAASAANAPASATKGSAPAATTGTAPPSATHGSFPAGWSLVNLSSQLSSTQSSPAGDGLTGLSCPSVSFCMILGANRYITWNGGSFAKAKPIVPVPSGSGGFTPVISPATVSCTSSDYCVGLSGGAYFLWQGQRWSKGLPTGVGSLRGYLACAPGTKECVAIKSGGSRGAPVMAVLAGGRWSTQPLSGSGLVDEVACSPGPFCLAADNVGDVYTWTGGTWSGPSAVWGAQTTDALDGFTCGAGPWCLAVGHDSGRLVADGGSGFTALPGAPAIFNVGAASCTGRSFCMVTTASGRYETDAGGAWTTHAAADAANLQELSCPSSKLCFGVAFGFRPQLAVYSGS